MSKKMSIIGMVVFLLVASVLPSNAWNTNDGDYISAFFSTQMVWNDPSYPLHGDLNLDFNEFKGMGKPIKVSKQSNGKAYPQCKNLTDNDLVARVIYAEICNLSNKKDNAFAVAQVIENRMGSNKTAREVVTKAYQFSSVSDGNSRFGDPSKDNDPETWAQCAFLAACLNQGDPIPTKDKSGRKYATSIGTRTFFYDVGSDIPFYDVNKNQIKRKSDIANKAKYYKANWNGRLYPLKSYAIRISNHVYFSF